MAKLLIPDRNIKVRIVRGRNGLRRRAYRVRAERALGRELKRSEEIHHHTAKQLVICQSHSYHCLLHARARIIKAGGNPDTQAICGRCRRLLALPEFSPNRANHTGRNPMCKRCERERWEIRKGRRPPHVIAT